jgi:alpha-N-arabinofuranosidase
MVAALNLNIFHAHCDRVKLTSIAQMVNVLQSMILTRGSEIVLTPTYYVFKMYAVHQGARMVPVELQTEPTSGSSVVPAVSASASRDMNGKLHISLANVDPQMEQKVKCALTGMKASQINGEIITAATVNAYNDFGKPESVNIQPFSGAQITNGSIVVKLPAKSIVTLEVR